MKTETQLISRDEFVAYWQNSSLFPSKYGISASNMLVFYGLYVLGFAIYYIVVCCNNNDIFCQILSGIGAVAYVILVPIITLRFKKMCHARFIRCPQCGDLFGGVSMKPNGDVYPKWQDVAQSGLCGSCGKKVLRSCYRPN